MSSAIALPALASTITGSVADSTGVRPLQGAEIRIPSLGRVTTADGAGRFRFTGLPSGTYEVVASFAGAGREAQSVTVREDGTVQLAFALAPAGTDIDTILVVGQQANLLSSLARQRAASNVVTVLTRDAIGQFPDQNVAESLRRAPGINVLNDQGEGRFVAVRGLSPDLNAASINGNRVLATGGDERTVALDVIPSELIESIEIQKSLTPDMDADTIGGSLDIQTTSAFDRKKGYFSVRAEGAYNELSGEWSPKFGGDFSTLVTENFGIAGGFSWNRRRFATDNIELDGWSESDDGIAYAEDVEYRDYDVQRVRWGGNLSLDFRPSDGTTLYVRGLYSKFDDTELRRRLIFGMSEQPASGTDTSATFDSADGRIEVRRDIKDRREIQSIATISAGGKTEVGPWTLRYDAAWSYADQQENGSVDPLRFRQRFQNPGALGVTFDYSNLQRPTYSIGFGDAAFRDPSRYRPSLLERTTREDATDREWSFRTDIGRSFQLANGEFEVQSGVRARLRTKEQRFIIDIFDGYDGDFTLADVTGRQTFGLADIEPTPDLGRTRDFLKANIGNFELNQLDTDFASNAENYSASEDVLAAYMLGRFDNDVIRVIGGLRVERTDIGIQGNRLDLVEEGGTFNGIVLDEDTLFISPVRTRRGYTDWLPSVNVRANVASDMVARLGMFRSLKRPGFGQQAPRFVIEENDEGDRTGEFGNPDLKPYRAWNFDATMEWYFAPKAVVQGGVFFKSISDFIVDEFRVDGTFAGIAFNEAIVPINGDRATVLGAEISYSHALTGLPAPFDGLIVNLNYTFTDAKGDVLTDSGVVRRIPLPAASKHTFNTVLGYDKGAVSFRIAGTFRDGYLDELGGSPDQDRYVRSHFQLDLSGRYRITPQFELFAELVNVNNAKYTAYQRGPGRDRLLQFEEYRMTAKFGVKANF